MVSRLVADFVQDVVFYIQCLGIKMSSLPWKVWVDDYFLGMGIYPPYLHGNIDI